MNKQLYIFVTKDSKIQQMYCSSVPIS